GRPFQLAGVRAGPWIRPALERVGLVGTEEQFIVSSWLIDELARELGTLAATVPRLRVVDARGTLGRRQWANEIHPTPGGFRKLAEVAWRPALEGLLA
ncbi:MAG TPA: hypothetical protein VFL14_00005, partial [Xanthomonadales bacterium]|nr:hypothetical protein [Xanthomonadales bacterium]